MAQSLSVLAKEKKDKKYQICKLIKKYARVKK